MNVERVHKLVKRVAPGRRLQDIIKALSLVENTTPVRHPLRASCLHDATFDLLPLMVPSS